MSLIRKYIEEKNNNNEKVLSVFLTAGFPDKIKFTKLALEVLEAGADMLEIGFPFSDPIADGPVIQQSSFSSLQNGVNLKHSFSFVNEIRKKTDKPLILMGYANPVLKYGIKEFTKDAKSSGVNGVIIPDVPIDEYDNFFNNSFNELDIILLTTPTTSNKRIKEIDKKSSGFVYCVSVSGITGVRNQLEDKTIKFVNNTKKQLTKNKMLVGFGISTPEDIKKYHPYCDGVIVGSAVIKSLMNANGNYKEAIELVKKLKEATINSN